MKLPDKPQAPKYQQLLIVLIATFCISPFLQEGIGGILLALMLLLYTIILVVRIFALPKLLLSVYTVIAFMAFGLQLSTSMGWAPSFNLAFGLLAQAIFGLYLGSTVFLIGRDIFTEPKFTLDTIEPI